MSKCEICTKEFSDYDIYRTCVKCSLPENRWVSVKDRLPEKDMHIIICDDKNKVMIGEYCETVDGSYFFTTNFEQYLSAGNITHWMPLPEPPKE